jgi:hypothetical protein
MRTCVQGTDADLRGRITIQAYLTPLNFSTCNTFIFKPANPCLNPPRSNTMVAAYSTGRGERCTWERIKGQVASECDCEANAALDAITGDCVCNLGTYGDGRRFCYPIAAPVWRDYYSEALTGQTGPPTRYGHGFVAVGDSMWLFGGYEDLVLNSTEEAVLSNVTNVTNGTLRANNTNGTNAKPPIIQTDYLGDLHVFSARSYTWTSYGDAVDFGGPPARAHHAMASWDRFIFVHGGVGVNGTVLGDLYMLDTYTDEEDADPQWTDLSTANNAPTPRLRHAMAAVRRTDGVAVVYVYGGVTQVDGKVNGDLYEFDIDTKFWRQIVYSKGPKPRSYHT